MAIGCANPPNHTLSSPLTETPLHFCMFWSERRLRGEVTVPQDLGKGHPCAEGSLEAVSEVLAMKSGSSAFVCPLSLPLPPSFISGLPQATLHSQQSHFGNVATASTALEW